MIVAIEVLLKDGINPYRDHKEDKGDLFSLGFDS
jgi:hypothetical protein